MPLQGGGSWSPHHKTFETHPDVYVQKTVQQLYFHI